MGDLYKKFAEVYDECGVSQYSLSFGQAMLEYFDRVHSEESFKKNLDICCGTGTLCGFFRDNGIETKGVDISGEMLAIARGKFPDIEFIESDVTEYEDDETFDFITCTDDALPHITDVDVVQRIIQNVNKLLRVGGLFIFDINYFYLIPFAKRIKSLDDFRKLVYNIKKEGKLIRFDVEYFENDELLWQDNTYEINFSLDEIVNILNDSGFVIELCSQHFLNEKRNEKWKIIAKKIE